MGEIGHKSYTYKPNLLELFLYYFGLYFMNFVHILLTLCIPSRRRILRDIKLKPNPNSNKIALAICMDGLGHLFHAINYYKVVSKKYKVSLVIYDPNLTPPHIKAILVENFPDAHLFEYKGSYLPQNKERTAMKSTVETILLTLWKCLNPIYNMPNLHMALYNADVCGIVNMYSHGIGSFVSLIDCKIPMITMAPQFYWLYSGYEKTLHPCIYIISRLIEGNGISIALTSGEMKSQKFCLSPPLDPSLVQNCISRQNSSLSYDYNPNKDKLLKIICYGTLSGHYKLVEKSVKKAIQAGRKQFIVNMFTPEITEIQKREDGYLVLHPISKKEYFKFLLESHAAMLSAGEAGPLEAAALGLRLLVVPTKGHDEQALNATLYEERELALVSKEFDLIKLLDFCMLPPSDTSVVKQKQAMKKWQDFLIATHSKWATITETLWEEFNKKFN